MAFCFVSTSSSWGLLDSTPPDLFLNCILLLFPCTTEMKWQQKGNWKYVNHFQTTQMQSQRTAKCCRLSLCTSASGSTWRQDDCTPFVRVRVQKETLLVRCVRSWGGNSSCLCQPLSAAGLLLCVLMKSLINCLSENNYLFHWFCF